MAHFGRGEVGDVLAIPPLYVKYVDVFSLKNLYVTMHELLMEEGWLGFEGQDEGMKTHTDLETLYSENVYQKGIHFGGKEYWIWWRAQKHYEYRRSEYFRNVLDIDLHCSRTSVREIVHQGKKMKIEWGELEVFFRPKIISDIGHKWENHKLLKHFKKIYEKRLMHAYLEKREKDLWRDAYRIQSKVKAYLNLKTWMPTPELFHAQIYGWEKDF